MIGLGEMKEDEVSIFSPPFPLSLCSKEAKIGSSTLRTTTSV